MFGVGAWGSASLLVLDIAVMVILAAAMLSIAGRTLAGPVNRRGQKATRPPSDQH
jgi:hypothetical protein